MGCAVKVRIFLLFALLQLACLPAPAQSARVLSNGLSVADYLEPASVTSSEMSPNGRWLAALKSGADGEFIMLSDLDAEELVFSLLPIDDTMFVNWLEWANDEWLIISATGFINLKGETFTRQQLQDPDYRTLKYAILPVTRLLLLKRDGSEMRRVFDGNRSLERRNLNLGRVVSFLPNDPDRFLIAARLRGDLDLFSISVSTGDHERVGVGSAMTGAWFVDSAGEPAIRVDVNSRGTRATYYGREEQNNGKIKWRKLRTVRLDQEQSTIQRSTEFRPLAPGPGLSTYYVAARPDGANTTGIYLYNFATDEYEETIRTNDKFDIENAFFNRETYDFLGSWHYEDVLKLEYADPGLQKHIDALSEFFEGKASIFPLDTSQDGKRWLLYASGPLEPGSIYLYDTDRTAITPLRNAYPALPANRLADVEIVRYTARDGMEISGYLTRPASREDGAPPPLIVMPHGGPEARDRYTFNSRAQTLAAQGYAVFQPNFRGSAGFGLAFADAGRRQWGKAMQSDIEDGFMYLVSTGKADRDRACIVGYSYGGYAALAAASLTPYLYKCIVAGAGPGNLVDFVKWVSKTHGSDSDVYEYWVEHIGHPSDDAAELRAVSPEIMAQYITAPVLLIHGKNDSIVPHEQSEAMEAALKSNEKTVYFLSLEDSGHSSRSDEDEQQEVGTILNFLELYLPVEAAED